MANDALPPAALPKGITLSSTGMLSRTPDKRRGAGPSSVSVQAAKTVTPTPFFPGVGSASHRHRGLAGSTMPAGVAMGRSYDVALNVGPGSANVKVLPKGPLCASVNWVRRPPDGSERVIVVG